MNINKAENDTISLKVLLRFWPVATVVLFVFIGVSFFISKDYVAGWIHVINLLLISILMPVCIKTKNVQLGINILPPIGMLTIMTFLFTGGPTNNGFWWSITYVVGAFFVTTKRWAIFWISLYFLLSFIIVVLSLNGVVKIAYDIPELLHLSFVFIITFAFVYLFNQVRESYLSLANKRAEELIRLNKELITANKELEEFAYVASHDLQEPLQTISNFVGLLEETHAGKLDEDTEQYLQFIVGSTAKMKILIKELLELSRVGRDTTFAIVDCNIILKEVLSEMTSLIEKNDAKISSSTLPIIQGNEIELKRLFQNLISNAIKFKKDNTTPVIDIVVEEKENEHLFSIKDNGIGVAEQFKERIFIIFQRLHTIDEYSGTGIGLATCKKVAALHNGKIWIESKLGEGSVFHFTLAKENLN